MHASTAPHHTGCRREKNWFVIPIRLLRKAISVCNLPDKIDESGFGKKMTSLECWASESALQGWANRTVLLGDERALLPRGERIGKRAIVLQPSTLLKFHDALVRQTYRRLFSSSHGSKKPGLKGRSDELIRAIVEIKSRDPRFGCPRIALIISGTFGIEVDKNIVQRVLLKYYRALPRGALVAHLPRSHEG
ncbi:MAG: hypothetical protein ACI8PT_004613 [Gammaproteobacteria bacterium]|jgi:hypothetical protein